jgi:hypothetical protein
MLAVSLSGDTCEDALLRHLLQYATQAADQCHHGSHGRKADEGSA